MANRSISMRVKYRNPRVSTIVSFRKVEGGGEEGERKKKKEKRTEGEGIESRSRELEFARQSRRLKRNVSMAIFISIFASDIEAS